MKRIFSRTILVATLALVAVAWSATTADAQYRRYGYGYGNGFGSGRPFPVVQNAFPAFGPTQLEQAAFRQWAYQTSVIGRVYSQYPPWAFGYNPYPSVVNYGPVFRYPTYATPYSYGYST